MEKEVYNLKVDFCEETGDWGLRIVGCETDQFYNGEMFTAFSSNTIAHDLTEHVNGLSEIGSVKDELIALGAVAHCRLYTQTSSGRSVSVDGLASDVSRMFELWLAFENEISFPVQDDCLYSEEIEEICQVAKRQIFNENADHLNELTHGELESYVELARRGMELGYNLQEERFPRNEDLERFSNIESAFRHSADLAGSTFLLREGDEYRTWRLEIEDLVNVRLYETTEDNWDYEDEEDEAA